MSLLKSSRGSFEDYFVLICIVVFLGIIAITYLLYWAYFSGVVHTSSVFPSNTITLVDKMSNGLAWWDNIIVMTFVTLMICSVFANVFTTQFFYNSVFSSVIGQLPHTVILVTNLHIVSLLAWTVGSVALYANKAGVGFGNAQ